MHDEVKVALDDVDLLIFSDFNYGCIPQVLVDALSSFCEEQGIMMVADSQSQQFEMYNHVLKHSTLPGISTYKSITYKILVLLFIC